MATKDSCAECCSARTRRGCCTPKSRMYFTEQNLSQIIKVSLLGTALALLNFVVVVDFARSCAFAFISSHQETPHALSVVGPLFFFQDGNQEAALPLPSPART
jgi:hypothetical protein